MAKVIGSVDDLRRPVVRVEVPDRDGFLAVVDTGFNRTLLLMESEARAMGFAITEETERVELGTSARATVLLAYGNILWLGRIRSIEAYVSDLPTARHRPDLARALLGTELMVGCLLLVDFPGRSVEVEEEA